MPDPFQAYERLLQTSQPPDLGPGPRNGVRSMADLERALGEIGHESAPPLIRALVLLWHDHLDEAHRLAQEIETADGSYVHAIMHRREPDYGNAKYWFRRVGQHPAFVPLAEQARPLLSPGAEKKLLSAGRWDPFAFVDACEQAARTGTAAQLLRNIQAAEFKVLLRSLLPPPAL